MRNYKLKFKNSAFFIVILIFLFLFLDLVNAQSSPQFLISWQSGNYAPSWYEGKLLPANGTPVEVAFELIDSGKPADLSKTKVRWYVNDELLKNEDDGLGIKSLKIVNSSYAAHETEIRITVVDYENGGNLDKIFMIPTAAAEAVINAPYTGEKISAGSSVLGAIPFFFNIESLDNLFVEWLVNGQKSSQQRNPFLLNLNIAPETLSGAAINISVSIKNVLKELEFANKGLQLRIQ